MARSGLEATFRYLAKTINETADGVLIAGLDARDKELRHRAQRALLERRSPAGHREILRRLPSLEAEDLEVVNERPDRLVRAVGDALKAADRGECAEICQAIAAIKLYDAIPALLGVLVEAASPHADLLAKAVLQLTDLFYEELINSAQGQSKLKRLDTMRTRTTSALEDALRKYSRHQRQEVVEAFLVTAKMKNVMLRSLIQRKQEACHEVLMSRLAKASRGGVIRLLLAFLEDPRMPRIVFDVIFSRSDTRFLNALFHRISKRLSKPVSSTLSQVKSLAWAQPGHELFAQLDDEAQHGAVRLLAASALPRDQVLKVIGYLLLEGKPGGRRGAAEALADFPGPVAAALIEKAIDDNDPEVRAHILKQLRPRKIPGAFAFLIRSVGSDDPRVRAALREALPEFSCQQFVTNFDTTPEAMRPVAGHIVRSIASDIEEELAEELTGLSPVRRRRALLAAGAMGIVPRMEAQVANLLTDEDHMVRVAAAQVLAGGRSTPAWEGLRDALFDKSVAVKEAAEQSLEMLSQSLMRDFEEQDERTREVESREVIS